MGPGISGDILNTVRIRQDRIRRNTWSETVEDFGNEGTVIANNDVASNFDNGTIGDERARENDHGNGFPLPPRYRRAILLFACLGNFVVVISKLYPSGFYLDFLQSEGLNKTYGTISISVMLISSAASPLIYFCLPQKVKNLSMTVRCLALCLINTLCIGLMSLVGVAIKHDSSGYSAFATIFTLRSVQGVIIGLLYTLVQGEIVDLYFKNNQSAMILISNFLQIGNMASAIVATRLYVSGGWLFVGLILATINFFPLILLPIIRRARNQARSMSRNQLGNLEETEVGNADPDKVKTIARGLAFYTLDVLVFFNNFTADLIAYVLPARIVIYNEVSLNQSVLLFQIGNVFSCLTALSYSYLAAKHKTIDTLLIMAACNALFYLGCLVTFSSTIGSLQLLSYPYQLCIGLALMGTGKAGHINLLIANKFALYEKWRLRMGGLGRRSAMINNVMLCLSSGLGSAVSGVFLLKEAEIPIICFLTGAGVVLSFGVVLVRLVK